MKKAYGKIKEEKFLEDSLKARDIVREVLNFGVNQHQIAKIVYLFSLELDNIEVMKEITALIYPLLEEEKENNFSNESIIT